MFTDPALKCGADEKSHYLLFTHTSKKQKSAAKHSVKIYSSGKDRIMKFAFGNIFVLALPLFLSRDAAAAIHSVDYPEKVAVGLERSPRVSLNGEWQFRHDPKEAGEKEKWFEEGKIDAMRVKVPL